MIARKSKYFYVFFNDWIFTADYMNMAFFLWFI